MRILCGILTIKKSQHNLFIHIFKKTLNKHNIMDMPSFMSKHTVFFYKKNFIEKKRKTTSCKMRHEVAKRITNNKNLCTRKKRIYKHWNGITWSESPSIRPIKQSSYKQGYELDPWTPQVFKYSIITLPSNVPHHAQNCKYTAYYPFKLYFIVQIDIKYYICNAFALCVCIMCVSTCIHWCMETNVC